MLFHPRFKNRRPNPAISMPARQQVSGFQAVEKQVRPKNGHTRRQKQQPKNQPKPTRRAMTSNLILPAQAIKQPATTSNRAIRFSKVINMGRNQLL